MKIMVREQASSISEVCMRGICFFTLILSLGLRIIMGRL